MGIIVMEILVTIVFVSCIYAIVCTIDAEVNAEEGKTTHKWNLLPYIDSFFTD